MADRSIGSYRLLQQNRSEADILMLQNNVRSTPNSKHRSERRILASAWCLKRKSCIQPRLTLVVRLRELRSNPIHECPQGATLAACARKDEMMADVVDVDSTTG
jgi:hypothetical protein